MHNLAKRIITLYEKKMKEKIIAISICLLTALILYYFMLPPLNLTSMEFWVFAFMIFVSCSIIWIIFSLSNNLKTIINNKQITKNKTGLIITVSILGIIVIIGLVNFINSPVFMSKSYHERIKIEEGNFTGDVKQVDFNELALLDKESSSKLGDRVMGQMTELVSQFSVSNIYTQVSYKDKIVRATPLEYASMIRYFTNRNEGISGYITVDSTDGESRLIRLENGMKYMPSAMFFENLYRKLRISYPTTIFGEINFEIDEEGNPYWVAQTIKYKGVGLKKEVSGVVVLDPTDGNSVKYGIDEVPEWVDHVYSADLIIEQTNDWGKYKNGFINSLFGQKEVVMTTRGYNYIMIDGDIYLYTGITSVLSDESNIGFILTNLRTKETKIYNVAGAEEYSAMASAVGQIQQMNYKSTFPLLINLDNKPTYLMSLKDNAGLVKMYAFVDYTDYQKVVVTDASDGIVRAAQNYLGGSITSGDEKELDILISSIQTAVLEGTTYYYIKDKEDTYRASIKVNQNILPFLSKGDKLKITYKESDIKEIIKLTK